MKIGLGQEASGRKRTDCHMYKLEEMRQPSVALTMRLFILSSSCNTMPHSLYSIQNLKLLEEMVTYKAFLPYTALITAGAYCAVKEIGFYGKIV